MGWLDDLYACNLLKKKLKQTEDILVAHNNSDEVFNWFFFQNLCQMSFHVKHVKLKEDVAFILNYVNFNNIFFQNVIFSKTFIYNDLLINILNRCVSIQLICTLKIRFKRKCFRDNDMLTALTTSRIFYLSLIILSDLPSLLQSQVGESLLHQRTYCLMKYLSG